jgi:hypothetical protein
VQIVTSLSVQAIGRLLRPNPSLNADVPHAWAAPTGGPPVSFSSLGDRPGEPG